MDLANLQSLFLSVVSNSTLHLLCQRTAQRADKNPDGTTGIPNGKWLQEYAMHIAKAIGSALVLALLCWAAAAARADKWPNWRGPTADGVASGSGYATTTDRDVPSYFQSL